MSSWMHIRSHFHTNSSSIFTHVCQWVLVHMTLISILFGKKTKYLVFARMLNRTNKHTRTLMCVIDSCEREQCVRTFDVSLYSTSNMSCRRPRRQVWPIRDNMIFVRSQRTSFDSRVEFSSFFYQCICILTSYLLQICNKCRRIC